MTNFVRHLLLIDNDMTLLTWNPAYSVGVEAVDYEHQEMISLINSVYAEMQGRNDAESVEQFLGDVHSAISAHFALEERAMRLSSYDQYAQHKEDHEELLEEIRSMMDDVHRDPERGIKLLQERLAKWFESHFATFDARLHGKLTVPH